MIVYLNGKYMEGEAARISPFDRGFLFGDGIYEAIPSYEGRFVGLQLHIDRMNRGLTSVGIPGPLSDQQWGEVAAQLSARNGGGNLGIYLHVSRGNEGLRSHRFPVDLQPTVFAMVIEIDPHPPAPDRRTEKGFKATTAEDLRWRRCDIKSTALLGNVLHYQQSYAAGKDETIMYNAAGELTEGSMSNVFVVKDGIVATPPLDHQKLPGISRHIVLESLRADGSLAVEERPLTLAEARNADEVWITNSSKHIGAVIELDGEPVGDGKVGPVWERAMKIYEAAKYSF